MLTLPEKYRPTNFDEVVGQLLPVRYLRSIVRREKLRHVLIHGPFGTGKTSLARIYAKGASCHKPAADTGNPCGKCEACARFDNKTLHDYWEVDCARTGGIDKVREIGETVRHPPLWARRRVIVLDEAQALSPTAQRGLLKSIEDLLNDAVIILLTTDPERLSAPLRSRLMPLEVVRLSQEVSMLLLEHVCRREDIPYELEALELITLKSAGHARNLLQHLDQARLYGDVTADDVKELLDLGHGDAVSRFMEAAFAGDLKQQWDVLQRWLPNEADRKLRFIQDFLLFLEYREVHGVDIVVRPDFLSIPAERRHQLGERLRQSVNLLGMSWREFARELRDIWFDAWATVGGHRYGSVVEGDIRTMVLMFYAFLHNPAVPRAAPALVTAPNISEATKQTVLARSRRARRLRRLTPLEGPCDAGEHAVRTVGKEHYLARAQVQPLWDRASRLTQKFGVLFNVRVEVSWKLLGVEHTAAATRQMGELLKKVQPWLARRGASFHWLYVHENDPELGPFTLVVAHITAEHARHAATLFRQRLAAMCERTVPRRVMTVEVIKQSDAAVPTVAVAWHWDSVRRLCRGLDPDLFGMDEGGNRQRLVDLLRIPAAGRRPAGVLAGDRFQSSRSLWDDKAEVAEAARMGFLSAFHDGAWSWLDRGWEEREWHDRLAEETARRRSEAELQALRPMLGDELVSERVARLCASWPEEPRKRKRSWLGWWERRGWAPTAVQKP